MLRRRTTKVECASCNDSLLDAIAMAIQEMDDGHLILDVIVDYGQNEALIIHSCNEDDEDE